MNYCLIPMDRSHLDGVARLEGLCFSNPWSERILTDALYQDGLSLVVAEGEGGILLGYAVLSAVLDEGCLERIAVDPAYRRQGVAEELLGAFLRFGRANLAFITLEVRESNEAAIGLYEKLGFQRVGRRKNYYRELREDAILMTVGFD